MPRFDLDNEINQLTRMDEPLRNVPAPRWQRARDKSLNGSTAGLSALSMSLNSMSLQTNPLNDSKPRLNTSSTGAMAALLSTSLSRPGSERKSPSRHHRSFSGLALSPRKSMGRTTSSSVKGDRFIPVLSKHAVEVGYQMQISGVRDAEKEDVISPGKQEYQKIMAQNLNGGDISQMRTLTYCNQPPTAPLDYVNGMKLLYSSSKTPGSTLKKTTRNIPQLPERILDAPGLMNDYYLNVLDWSWTNRLAVALTRDLFLWNSGTGDIQTLVTLPQGEYISSVSFINDGTYLAVGTSSGSVQIWDPDVPKKLRTMNGVDGRIAALSWNEHILSSGSRSGQIMHSDVRVREHNVGVLTSHTQEVCGLKWSPDGRYLASGGNDNIVNIWSSDAGSNRPLYTFTDHRAAVKGLAWCPWQPSVLASGGGSNDRTVKFWNCNLGECLNSVDARSQVCAVLWSEEYKEFITGHGYAQNQLILWKYPSMDRVAELNGHTARVLHMAQSPCRTFVVSAAADETIRLWKCFGVDSRKKKAKALGKESDSSISLMSRLR